MDQSQIGALCLLGWAAIAFSFAVGDSLFGGILIAMNIFLTLYWLLSLFCS